MTPADRLSALRACLDSYRGMDPAGWDTGLSAEGARRAHDLACGLVAEGVGGVGAREGAPRRLLIWCAGNVFTAALEWVATFSLLGSEVVIKAPSRSPASTLALAEAFAPLGVTARALPHAEALPLLDEADAVLAFGSDEAMRVLAARIPVATPRSLHGHRLSAAIVGVDGAVLAEDLALDAALYDGQGCMSPAAVFTTGDPQALAEQLNRAFAELDQRMPPGAPAPDHGPRWRRRTGLARVVGTCLEGPRWAAPVLPASYFEASPPPRMLPIHPVASLDELSALREHPLSSCAVDGVDPVAVAALGFTRICRPGALQRPPFGRPHDGVDVVDRLCRRISWEL